MKRVFVCIALVALSIGAIAQTKAVKIESPIETFRSDIIISDFAINKHTTI